MYRRLITMRLIRSEGSLLRQRSAKLPKPANSISIYAYIDTICLYGSLTFRDFGIDPKRAVMYRRWIARKYSFFVGSPEFRYSDYRGQYRWNTFFNEHAIVILSEVFYFIITQSIGTLNWVPPFSCWKKMFI